MEWYYDDNGTQVGPLTQEAFYAAVREGKVLGSTKVWCQGWPDWKTYDEYQAAPQEAAEAAASSGGSESSGGADPNKNMKIGIAVVIAAGAAFFLLKGGDPSCESACKHAVSVVGEDKDWSRKRMAKETRECVDECTDTENDGKEAWSGTYRNCIAGIKSRKAIRDCDRAERKAKAERKLAEIRRDPSKEAIDQLDKIYKGAAYYYTAPHVNANGSKLPCQFPEDQGVTPSSKTCCGSRSSAHDLDKDERCDSNPGLWTTGATWASLTFQINDQHFFTYEFDWNGKTLSEAMFTASAYADLDCDGEFSTFQRLGYGDPSATRSECAMKGSAAFYVENETE
jgi:hypothetical protein